MHRLFFALWPHNALRQAIAETAAALRAAHPSRARPVRTDRLHLTVRFLGDQPELLPGRLEALCAMAAAVRVEVPPFCLDCAGHFQRGRVWWLGSSRPIEPLAQLHCALRPANGPPQDAEQFVPHVTIARNAGVPVSVPITPIAWAPREFVLIDSAPGQGYRVLGRWPLAA